MIQPTSPPITCATMNPATSPGAMPANVSVRLRAMVAALNQEAAVMVRAASGRGSYLPIAPVGVTTGLMAADMGPRTVIRT
jgi:hypothetical protein